MPKYALLLEYEDGTEESLTPLKMVTRLLWVFCRVLGEIGFCAIFFYLGILSAGLYLR